MLGPSLKSVPGCLVSMVPMLIGEPVAATPGLVPRHEVVALPVPPLPAAALDVLADPLPAALELLLPLLPHPASASSASMAPTASSARDRGTTYLMLTALLSSKVCGRTSRSARSCAHSSRGASCMQDGANPPIIDVPTACLKVSCMQRPRPITLRPSLRRATR